jgi:hypothetical protein
MPTVLTSVDREDVERRLMTSPSLAANPPQVLVALIGWITATITSLLNYVSQFLGVISDNVATLVERVAELEENFPHVAPAAQPTTPTQTMQQSPCPSARTRCKRCHALRHNTPDCRSRDPVAVKKRVSNNQKAWKQQQEATQLPASAAPYHLSFDPLRYIHQPILPTSTHALLAQAADTKELRRRKMQSMQDKHRKGARPSAAK